MLLDPAFLIPGHVALLAAESVREDKTYISSDKLVERRYDESWLQRAPRDLVEADLTSHVDRPTPASRSRRTMERTAVRRFRLPLN